jgi:hypothetical protein
MFVAHEVITFQYLEDTALSGVAVARILMVPNSKPLRGPLVVTGLATEMSETIVTSDFILGLRWWAWRSVTVF